MAFKKFISLRLKLGAALAALSLVIATGVVAMFVLQLEGVERAALLEAEHFADLIAFTASDEMDGRPELLETYVEGLNAIFKRDVVIVDRNKRGIADANKSEIGQVFTHDGGNEVASTMGDGKVRTFVEQNDLHIDGAKQLVVPLRKNHAKRDSAIVGAVIVEYTQIYEDLLDAERLDLYLSAALAIGCVLLATVLGFRVANKVVTGLKNLQRGVERVAKGDYSESNLASPRDEIGILANAFNEMAKELDASRAELALHQRELEDRVVARTSELHSANGLLQNEINERKAAAERIQYLAYYDSLTGLPNRRMFSELLTRSISHARRHENCLAVLFIDLDRFKTINDTLGHEAGDSLLNEVAKRLKSSLREHDIVARLGGDEFVVLLPDVTEETHASAVAQKILTAIGRPLVLLRQEFRITASVGITTYPKDGADEPTLMKNADVAMYQAKAEGKNNFQFYSEELNANSFERLTLESSLRRALERHEFALHFQPKIDFPTGRITGVEALLRWQHQDLGTLGPTRFISIAEETGLIIPIGRWVLKSACLQNVAWQREGLPELTMAVNLSARQFNDENLLHDVADILEDTGMDPALLELEITESMLMHNVEKAIKTLNGLKQIGVRLAIDDFGTGYSSLSNLKKFPINTIKVDRSFIRDIPGNPEDVGITDAIIAMGRTLSLTVVAEGVETKEQAEFLRQHACDEFQGFYFSKAVRPTEFAKLLRAQELPDALETLQVGE